MILACAFLDGDRLSDIDSEGNKLVREINGLLLVKGEKASVHQRRFKLRTRLLTPSFIIAAESGLTPFVGVFFACEKISCQTENSQHARGWEGKKIMLSKRVPLTITNASLCALLQLSFSCLTFLLLPTS